MMRKGRREAERPTQRPAALHEPVFHVLAANFEFWLIFLYKGSAPGSLSRAGGPDCQPSGSAPEQGPGKGLGTACAAEDKGTQLRNKARLDLGLAVGAVLTRF